MKTSHSFSTHHQTSWTASGAKGNKGGAIAPASSPIVEFSLIRVIRRLWIGLMKWYTAFRYQIYFYHTQIRLFFRKTTVRLAILGLAVLFVFRQDMRFSILIPALGKIEAVPSSEGGQARRDQMSLAHPVALSGSSASFKAAGVKQLDPARAEAYIQRFEKAARLEMDRFGIPASILMAQALADSWAGAHTASVEQNNHFGKPMAGRSYASAWENWREHSMLLAREYPQLLMNGRDYKAWAKGLERSGYASDRRYSRKLLDMIDRFQLQRLDR
ncbi:MAG: glucosaminidase domain-containing protein [Haliscomenobacter sp.]|nr:glucosaminidase domain-containing protein [Haliscomenobacter sp.]MBK8879301.1 glucosaminidase domain-containing protein [Haliscomenobacter sp.]